ncbi:glycosyl transferase [Fibrobacterales bacterium]|nr:glycosyl transferase [Fibrobacterales bacterium]
MAKAVKKTEPKPSLYGYFDDAAKEYVLTNPATPIKWCNYVGTLAFGGIVDTTGGTVLCKGDPALNRITKYISQLPAGDFKGSTVYLRIKEKEGYKLLFPFMVPNFSAWDKWECRVGLSYSRWVAEGYGLKIQITVFVPTKSSTLIQDIVVENISNKDIEVDVIPVYEFSHFDALKQLTNADWVPQTMTLDAHKEKSGHIILEQYAFMKKKYAVNYFTASAPATSFDGDRREFLGMNEIAGWRYPISLHYETLTNSTALRGDNIAAQMFALGKIAPKKSKRVATQLGQEKSLAAAMPAIKKYRDLKNVDKAFAELAEFWTEYLKALQVKTPDASFNSMVNVHNPRQCHTTKNWSRYLSLYQLGFGSDRGIGYRDSSQDLLGVMSHMPQEARELAENLLSVQKEDGSAMHQYFPSSMEANEGDSREKEDRPKYYGDDHLWIVLTVASYLKETGDYKFLEKLIPFYSKKKELKAREKGTVLEHLKRSLAFSWNDKGKHGIPHLGFADWNDTVNLPTGAESVFNAALFARALNEMVGICEAIGAKVEAKKYADWYKAIAENVNKSAWDGKWFVRWFDEKGKPLGSAKNKVNKIDSLAQSWTTISGIADAKRAKIALDSVNKILNTKNGIKLSAPGYNGFDPHVGGVSTYPPGAKENGGIFLHANPWIMIAETIVGNGDRAFQYYNQINPAAKNNGLIDEFESEPYCYPQNILGNEHKQFGLARNAWLSGTSSWTYQAATQYILGIRASHNGLLIDPCIPKAWKEFSVSRKYRGATYEISVKNSGGVSKGVRSAVVDGKAISVVGGVAVLPIAPKGKRVKVEVELG